MNLKLCGLIMCLVAFGGISRNILMEDTRVHKVYQNVYAGFIVKFKVQWENVFILVVRPKDF